MTIYLTDKKLGVTPLEALEKIRKHNKIPKEISMTYAGRLDPAATGLLLILSDKDVKEKEKYTSLPKTYEVEIIFGIKTDTGDLLGIPEAKESKEIDKKILQKTLKKLIGKRTQNYHPFSSKNIDGSPLWKRARENKINKLPTHEIEIKEIKILDAKNITFKKVTDRAKKICRLVKGDFRQNKILKSWKSIKQKGKLKIFKLKVSSSSGTYMRVLAEEIGELLGENCVCFSIKRTKIGKFKLKRI